MLALTLEGSKLATKHSALLYFTYFVRGKHEFMQKGQRTSAGSQFSHAVLGFKLRLTVLAAITFML